MKIGIMTYHYSYNFGAMIQAYALRIAIKDLVGEDHDVEIINYIPSSFTNQGESIINSAFLEKKEKRDCFLRERCGILTQPTTDLSDINDYDVYVVGSDQVWNPNLPVFERTSEYFLDFVPDGKRRVAYAASIGEQITEDFSTELFEENIGKFDFLSMREQSYCSFIERFTDKKCEAVLDPTFLLDATHYRSLYSKDIKHDSYTLCVAYGMKARRRLYDIANRYSIQNKQQIVHSDQEVTSYLFMNQEKTIFYSSMEEILWYIDHAEMVITDSFHFVVFSIIFHRPFYVMLTGKPSRITDLLAYLDLSDRILSDATRLSELNSKIDYETVDKKIFKKRELSYAFLKAALMGENKNEKI